MTYRDAFPDFAPESMPAVPAIFGDVSWRQDVAPSFACPLLGLRLWIDYADPAAREFPELPRFTLAAEAWTMAGQLTDGAAPTLAESDDWRAIQVAMIGETFARILQNDMTAEQWTRMRLANFSAGPGSPCCASHDTRDSNMDMAQAFALIMGREPGGSFETHYDSATGQSVADDPAEECRAIADSALWNEAWDYTKARHLSGDDVDYSAPKVGAVVEFQNGILGEIVRAFAAGFAVIYSPGYGAGGDDGDYIPARFEVISHDGGGTEDSLTFVAHDENGLPDLEGAVEVVEDLLSRTDGGDED